MAKTVVYKVLDLFGNEEIKDLYRSIWSDEIRFASKVKGETTQILIKKAIIDFIKKIYLDKVSHVQLALDLSNEKILAWFVINDDDTKSEEAIILCAAQTNAAFYSETGISIETIIVETGDNVPIPSHFMKVNELTQKSA